MADLKFQAGRHDRKAFLEKASKRQGFSEAYEALEVEYSIAEEIRGRCRLHAQDRTRSCDA